MSDRSLLSLQNGSDVRGVAMGEDAALTCDAVNRIARAFAAWLSLKSGKPLQQLTVGVGHDSRLTADSLTAAALQGLGSTGVRALCCGLASTPAMFMGTVYPESAFDGSVMLTASHMPMDRNGMKFFTPDGGLESEDVRALLAMADRIPSASGSPEAGSFDLMSLYTADLRRKICDGVECADREHPLRGLHVAVDACNGAGGFFVSQVLIPLGCDTSGSVYLEPDGSFPNHAPNPENERAMQAIRLATLNSGADLGLIFDTDVDRMSAVLSDGSVVGRDALIAMMAAILAPEYPGSTVVTDSVTSDRLTEFLEHRLHLRHRRFRRGYRNVINEARRLTDSGTLAPLAIETSGHGAVKDNYYLDDGAYLAVRLLIAAARLSAAGETLDSLIADFRPPFEAREYRVPLTAEDPVSAAGEILASFERRCAAVGLQVDPTSCEGVRVSDRGGWMLLRMSLHEPVMPLNVEGNEPGDCDRLAGIAKAFFSGIDSADPGVFG